MLLSLSCVLITLSLTTASPIHNNHESIISYAANIVRRVDVSANTTNSDEFLSTLIESPTNIDFDRPLGNNALWQEALSNDNKSGTKNSRMIYHNIAYFQEAENSSQAMAYYPETKYSPKTSQSDSLFVSSEISQGLQHLRMYPAQFNRPQASDPMLSLVQLSPTPQQTIRSFGASGAWWPNFLKGFPPAQQKNLSSILFSEDGLHLSGYRYNLGGSGDKDAVAVSGAGRGVESFMNTDGSYDWSRDGAGEYYLQAASEANVSSITAFVNSIPSALTESKRPCGNTLNPSNIPQVVAYITEVLTHFAQKGINIDYISPMNEPDSAFEPCIQEGMSVNQSIRADVFQSLRAALRASNSSIVQNTKVLGDETAQIASQALVEYGSWLTPAINSQNIDAIAVHMYDWPDDATLLNYRQLVINSSLPSPPPPIKMTEISSFRSASGVHAPWGWTGPQTMGPEYDPGINSALDMARYIWQWLTLVNAESWDWWTAVSNMMPCSPSTTPGCAARTYSKDLGWNDGLLYIDPNYATTRDYTFYFTKRFWVFQHFTKFFRPGAVRFDIPNEILPYGTVAVAAKNVDGAYATTFINRNATVQTIRMRCPGAGRIVTAAVQTTDKDDFEHVALPVVGADGIFKITLPAKSVVSVQFTVSDAVAAPTAGKRGVDLGGLLKKPRRDGATFAAKEMGPT